MRAPALALALAALAVGCGGGQAGPPRGPHHDPVNSPEAKSKCPDEWKAAKKAREELLGAMDNEGRRAAAAQTVLAQARCEHAFFDKWTSWTPELHEKLAARIRDAQGARFRIVRYAALGE